MKALNFLLILVLALTAGCAFGVQEGRMIDRSKLAAIVPGETTADQMVASLGQPMWAVKGQHGEDVYHYRFYQDSPTHWYQLDRQQGQRVDVSVVNGLVQKIDVVDSSVDKVNRKS